MDLIIGIIGGEFCLWLLMGVLVFLRLTATYMGLENSIKPQKQHTIFGPGYSVYDQQKVYWMYFIAVVVVRFIIW